MATNIQTNYLSFLPLVSRVASDAKVFPLGAIDFTVDTNYVVDLTAPVQSAQLAHGIQGCYVDGASALYGPMVMQIFGTGQQITVQAGIEGYFPLLCTPNSYIFTFTNLNALGQPAGQGTFSIYFVNIPVVAATWPGGGGYGN